MAYKQIHQLRDSESQSVDGSGFDKAGGEANVSGDRSLYAGRIRRSTAKVHVDCMLVCKLQRWMIPLKVCAGERENIPAHRGCLKLLPTYDL